jgi:uncharacterized protein
MRGALAVLALVAALVIAPAGALVAADRAELLDAIKRGDSARAVALIEAGIDPDASDADGTSALIWAAYYEDAAVAEALIRAGATIDTRNDFGASALGEAALTGSTRVIELLLAGGIDPDAANPEGETALMLVARTGNVDAARRLLTAGADVNAVEQWGGQSALMWAVTQLQPEMVKFLIDHGADVNARGRVHPWSRRITAEPRPKDMHRGGFTPLLYAARADCIACAAHLIAGGADPDLPGPDGTTPLMLAVMNGHFDFAHALIDAGADVNRWDLWGRTPLYVAIDMRAVSLPGRGRPLDESIALARRLLAEGANPNAQLKLWRPPFRDRIFERGSDNTLSTGATPLLRAAHSGDNEAVRLLLEYDALVDLPNANGITPLLAASGVGLSYLTDRARSKTEADAVESVSLLVAAGADVNALTEETRRVQRIRDPRIDVVPFSFHYSDVPPSGRSAVHGAARQGWNDVIGLLARHGAKVDFVDAEGKSPIDLAMGRYVPPPTVPDPVPYPETVALLEELGAAR